jgi:hypothetical protein
MRERASLIATEDHPAVTSRATIAPWLYFAFALLAATTLRAQITASITADVGTTKQGTFSYQDTCTSDITGLTVPCSTNGAILIYSDASPASWITWPTFTYFGAGDIENGTEGWIYCTTCAFTIVAPSTPGIYTHTVYIETVDNIFPGSFSGHAFTLTVTLTAQYPTLIPVPTSLSFTVPQGTVQSQGNGQPLTISSSSGNNSNIFFTLTPSQSWINMDGLIFTGPTPGSTTGVTPQQHTVWVNTTGLAIGTYTGNITVAAPTAATDGSQAHSYPCPSASPCLASVNVPVTLNVTAPVSSITVNTSPPGLGVTIDGTAYTSPQTMSWVQGSSHTIAAATQTSSGTRNTFSSWSNSGTASQTIVVPSTATTYTATFTTQYLLTTAAAPTYEGTIVTSPASPTSDGFYAPGASVQLTATVNSGFQFVSFSGALTGTTNPQSITMSAPQSVTANFARFVQQGAKLVDSSGSANGQQGFSTALSADGNTALIGGRGDSGGVGAAWVYTRSSGVWTKQAKLIGTGNVGASNQGQSVALSADGNTAMVSGWFDNGGVGAVWVFTRSAGVWTQQGSKLVASGAVGNPQLGGWAALSADGNTLVAGGANDNSGAGAMWVFTRSAGVWTQQGNKLYGTGGIGNPEQGYAVALSADGNTAVSGADYDNAGVGAAWVFTRSGGVWTQQGSKLVGANPNGLAYQGRCVGISGDGATILVGGAFDSAEVGAVWVFTLSGGVWTQQGSKLTPSDAVGAAAFGIELASSTDGNTILIGGDGDNSDVGAAWVFTRSAGVWSQQGPKLVGTGGVGAASAGVVALSGDGNTMLSGGPGDNNSIGATWVFTGYAAGQSIFSFNPASVSTSAAASTGSTSLTTTPSGAAWNAYSSASWLTITSATSGSGNATIAYSAQANAGSQTRSATITVGNAAFTVTQSAFFPALTISKSHVGTFTQGQPSGIYTLNVSNGTSTTGIGATSGTVTVTDNAPTGLTVSAMSGTGWTCTGNSCTRSDSLAAGASYPAITVSVNVATNAASSLTNSATVSGGGSATVSASDPTTILTGAAVVLTRSLNPSTLGEPVTLVATLSSTAATGKVTFYDGVTVLGTSTLVNGQAVLIAKFLPVGTSSLMARYEGDSNYGPNYSAPLTQTVVSFAQNGLQSTVNYSLLNSPVAIAVGDFNGDGRADLAVAAETTGSIPTLVVSVMMGNGNGTFQTAVNYGLTGYPVSIAVADVNGDGKADIVVACYGTGTTTYVNVLLGKGDGTFQGAVSYLVDSGGTADSLAVGDFNGDGKPDLAVSISHSTNAGAVDVLLGNGDGTFQTAVPYSVGVYPYTVVAGDFNGDGKADLATVNRLSNTVSVLLGNGDGTFQSQAAYATTNFAYNAAVGDFNGDGKPDLAVPIYSSNTVNILLGNGDGTFQAAASYSAGTATTGAYAVAVGDFNGDGKLDLAVTNYNTGNVDVLLGNGNGTFQTAVGYTVASSPNSILVGDYNGDGLSDLAVANNGSNNVSILLGQAASGTTASLSAIALNFGNQTVGVSSAPQTVTLTNTGTSVLTVTSVAMIGPTAAAFMTGDFSQTNTCTTVAAGASCTINVIFTPSTSGLRTGIISITDNAAKSPQTIRLTGTGIAVTPVASVSLSTINLNFGSQAVNTTSAVKTVTLTNNGGSALTVTSITASAGFSQTNNCSTVAVSSTCSINVTFTPSKTGLISGVITIVDSAVGSPQVLRVSGTGTSGAAAVGLSKVSLNFGSQAKSTTSSAQTVTVTNTGSAALTITAVTASGDFAATGCVTSLAVGASCSLNVTFTPTATGTRRGVVMLTDNAAGSPQVIQLFGSGM